MRALSILLGALACLLFSPVYAATTLLPNGMQCFTDANGPIVSGSLNMFFPGTTTPKPTWQDQNQGSLNSQPIQLDANGCATIYGIGSYRQQLFDGPVVSGAPTGNLIWDKLTTDTSAYNAVFWAGLAGGTPNVILVTDPGFNATDGTVINFVALSTNTGATTINPSGFGAIPVVKDTSSGPTSLTGGEIIQSNIISVVYSATANNFHLLNTVIATASGNTQPFCSFSNLKITNDAGTPSSIVDITADQVLLQSASGQVIARSNVSVTINITQGTATSTAGGMDGESPGTNAWLYLFVIDNGAGPSAVGTLSTGNGLTPNMPSGYTYKCRAGGMRVDNTGNLLRTLQRGRSAQYTVTPTTNTAALPQMAVGVAGNVGGGVYAAVSVSNFVPPTAAKLSFVAQSFAANGVLVAPNNNYGANGSTVRPAPVDTVNIPAGLVALAQPATFVLESTNIYWASTTANNALWALGWEDAVNAF